MLTFQNRCMHTLLRHTDYLFVFTDPATGNKKFRFLSDADLFRIHARALQKGHPWVIVEALAAGLPIISDRSGGDH